MFDRIKKWLAGIRSADAGSLGEKAAAEWLRREKGFEILLRNWRSPKDRRDELDLICRDVGILVFVEVKTRSASALVPGYFAVDRRKKRVVRRACDAYLRSLRDPPPTFRFDVVEVTLQSPGTVGDVRHFENIPIFSKHYAGWRR